MMSKRVFVGMAWLSAVVPLLCGAPPASGSSLILVNLKDEPLEAVAVPLPAGRLYSALGVEKGRPLKFADVKGKILPCQLDRERDVVWLLCRLPPGEGRR